MLKTVQLASVAMANFEISYHHHAVHQMHLNTDKPKRIYRITLGNYQHSYPAIDTDSNDSAGITFQLKPSYLRAIASREETNTNVP